MADEDISPYVSWPGKTRCPWILFHANALTLLDTLYGETCSSQAKINKFITAAKRHFARSPTRGKKSKKQACKVIHIPGESCSKQKATATNRQSHQPTPTSCRDRSLTPHPFGRGKADTREERQPTSNSHRARSPTLPGDVGALPLLRDVGMPTPGPSRKAIIHSTLTQFSYTITQHTAL